MTQYNTLNVQLSNSKILNKKWNLSNLEPFIKFD